MSNNATSVCSITQHLPNSTSGPRLCYEGYMRFLPKGLDYREATPKQIENAKRQLCKEQEYNLLKRYEQDNRSFSSRTKRKSH